MSNKYNKQQTRIISPSRFDLLGGGGTGSSEEMGGRSSDDACEEFSLSLASIEENSLSEGIKMSSSSELLQSITLVCLGSIKQIYSIRIGESEVRE